MPTWWSFPQKPRGRTVGPDGTFVLPQVGPGKYNVFFVVPASGCSMPLVAGVELSNQIQPLSLRADLPSPGWQCTIDGSVRFVGAKPEHSIHVFAESLDNDRFREGAMFHGGRFRLGPIPPGRYRLTFESPEIKTKLLSVVAPATGLKVDVKANSPIPIHGLVSVRGAKGLEPLGDFRVRVWRSSDPLKFEFASQRRRHPFNNSQGEYSGNLPGPELYRVEAAADGYAIRSEPIDAEHLPKEGVNLTLTKCVRVTGMVVDEHGWPIDDAIVNSVAKADGHLRGPTADPIDGTVCPVCRRPLRVQQPGPGPRYLSRRSPRIPSTIVENLKLPREGDEPLRIVMTRGGTICGHVRDDDGQPLQGVKLHLHRTQRTFPRDLDIRSLGNVVTDANGYYEVRALPEQLIQIQKFGGGGRSPGVFLKCVVPSRTQKRTVDFGGPSRVRASSSSMVAPLGENSCSAAKMPNSGFAAKTYAAADGSFAFSGVPLGKHDLLASGTQPGEWIRVRALAIHSASQSFGRIDFGITQLTVNVAGMLKHVRQEDVYLND